MSRLDRILREQEGCLIGNRVTRWNPLLAYVIDCPSHPCYRCLCDPPNIKRLIRGLEDVSTK